MSIHVRCQNPACRKPLRSKEENSGKRLKCPACGAPVLVGASQDARNPDSTTNAEGRLRSESSGANSNLHPPSTGWRHWAKGGIAWVFGFGAVVCLVAIIVSRRHFDEPFKSPMEVAEEARRATLPERPNRAVGRAQIGPFHFAMSHNDATSIVEKDVNKYQVLKQPYTNNQYDQREEVEVRLWPYNQFKDDIKSLHVKLRAPIDEIIDHAMSIHCYFIHDKLFKVTVDIPLAYGSKGTRSAFSGLAGRGVRELTWENGERIVKEVRDVLGERYQECRTPFVDLLDFEYTSKPEVLPAAARQHYAGSKTAKVYPSPFIGDGVVVVISDSNWRVQQFGPDVLGTRDFSVSYICPEIVERLGPEFASRQAEVDREFEWRLAKDREDYARSKKDEEPKRTKSKP